MLNFLPYAVITVGFESQSDLRVTEGQNVSFCVVIISGTPQREVSITLETLDMSATGKMCTINHT